MLTQHIALVPETDGVNLSEIARISAALQKQVLRDLAPIWGVSATVDAFGRLEDVPVGYWPILFGPSELAHEAGVYLDDNGQPYARVALSPRLSLDASRACLELLVNPCADRTVTAPSPRSDQGLVEYLIEVCGTCEDSFHSYLVNDVVVSDFCTPEFFSASPRSRNDRYSFFGCVTAPFQLLAGGHLTWFDHASRSWWTRNHWGENPVDVQLGAVERRFVTVRELSRRLQPARTSLALPRRLDAQARFLREHAVDAAQMRAQHLRALLERARDQDGTPPAGAFGSDDTRDARGSLSAFVLVRDSDPAKLLQKRERELASREDEAMEFAEEDDFRTVVREPAMNPMPVTQPVVSAAVASAAPSVPPPLPSARPARSVPPTADAQAVVHPSIAPVESRLRAQEVQAGREGRMIAGFAVTGAALFGLFWLGGGAVDASPHQATSHAPQGTELPLPSTPAPAPAPIAAPAMPAAENLPAAGQTALPQEPRAHAASEPAAPSQAASQPAAMDSASVATAPNVGPAPHRRRQRSEPTRQLESTPVVAPVMANAASAPAAPATPTLEDLLDSRR